MRSFRRGLLAVLVGGLLVTPAAASAATWSLQTTTDPGAHGNGLAGVSCPSSTACTAVGSQYDATDNATLLIERWNGTSWSTQTGATPSGATSSSLGSVSCASATACVAVGSFFDGTSTVTLAEHWDGSTWSVRSTPNPSGATDSALNAVSCTASTACTAVGTYSDGLNQHAFVERWNGTSWAAQTVGTAPAGATDTTLNGVSCTTATACAAVGSYTDTGGTFTLSETWNGSAWTVQRAANPAGATLVSLSGISCTTSNSNCTAVGDFATFWGNVVERYNGSTWTLQSGATPAGTTSYQSSVSCTSSTACQAVGTKIDTSATTYAENWNGTTWTSQTVPNPAASANAYLLGVSCTSSTACTAVGYYIDSTTGYQVTIAERFS
jgi:hypothetical protein